MLFLCGWVESRINIFETWLIACPMFVWSLFGIRIINEPLFPFRRRPETLVRYIIVFLWNLDLSSLSTMSCILHLFVWIVTLIFIGLSQVDITWAYQSILFFARLHPLNLKSLFGGCSLKLPSPVTKFFVFIGFPLICSTRVAKILDIVTLSGTKRLFWH